MSAFRPVEPWTIAAIGAVLLVLLVGGYALSRRAPGGWVPKVGWTILVAGVPAIERLTAREPAFVRMLALIAFALVTLKLIAVARERAAGMPPLSFTAWLAFSSAWLGMRPRLFISYGAPARDGAPVLLRRGAVNLALGLACVALARAVWSTTESRWAATIPLLVGLSLCLHFGLGTLLAGVWRLRGVETDAVFRAPLRSENLAEFWSKRWNLGFSEMTAALIYRPLSRRVGSTAALLAGFLASGLLHEMAISVPVRAGFGLPTLYFVLHGVLVGVERRLSQAGRPLSGRLGRAWSMFWILAPLPLLFHPPFLAGVVWPLLGVPAAHEP
ncbi:MAG TPA: MBOAT family protein [Polyangiaceae bacterium]